MRNDFSVSHALVDGRLPTRPTAIPALTDEIWNFMIMCWQRDPGARPSMRESSEIFRRLARKSRAASIVFEDQESDEESYHPPARRRLSQASANPSQGHLAPLPESGQFNGIPRASTGRHSRASNLTATSSSGSSWGGPPVFILTRTRAGTLATLPTPESSPTFSADPRPQRPSTHSPNTHMTSPAAPYTGPGPRDDGHNLQPDSPIPFMLLPPAAIQGTAADDHNPSTLSVSPRLNPVPISPTSPPTRPPIRLVEHAPSGSSETSPTARKGLLNKFSFKSLPRSLPSTCYYKSLDDDLC